MKPFNNETIKVYVFGNPLIKEDSLPLKIIPNLKKKFPRINFIIYDPNENFPPKDEKNLLIIDTVIGINQPMLFDLNDLSEANKTPISPHDYDLLFHLQLLKKMKKINRVKIIGLPADIKEDRAILFINKKLEILRLRSG